MSVKLSEICFGITDGSHNPPKSGEKSEYLMLSSKNVYDDRITYEDPRYLSEQQFVSENRRTDIKPGDVLMTIVGTVGRTAVVKAGTLPITLQRSVAVLHPNTDICSSRYLMYLLRSKRSFFEAESHGVAQKGIYLKQLSDVNVEIPELEKQYEVTTILDKISEVIQAREAEIVALDELVKARFVELFVDKDYPLFTIDELSLGKGEYGAQSASVEYDPSRPRYVRITDINDDGSLNDDVVSSINKEDDEQYKLEYGDFLFARMGATVGKTYAFKSGEQIYAGYLIRYKLNLNKITPEYLYSYTKLDEYWNWVRLNQSGAAQPGINAKKYGSLQIPVAPLSEQKNFQEFVKQVDKSKVAVQKALDEAQLLFDSLMQEYFG